MTEAEWLACQDPTPMVEFVRQRREAKPRPRGVRANRKFRLFACAACRAVWPLLRDDRSHTALEVAERYADSLASKRELEAAYNSLLYPFAPKEVGDNQAGWLADNAVLMATEHHRLTGRAAGFVTEAAWESSGPYAGVAQGAALCSLLRCIYGNLFGAVGGDRHWFTPVVLGLAQAAYDQRQLPSGELSCNTLAVLSDALEEAGCTDDALLTHLRSPGPHVRGCWALDLILGKS